eukprot:1195287-Prorocentrum_minimum.AAC.3
MRALWRRAINAIIEKTEREKDLQYERIHKKTRPREKKLDIAALIKCAIRDRYGLIPTARVPYVTTRVEEEEELTPGLP